MSAWKQNAPDCSICPCVAGATCSCFQTGTPTLTTPFGAVSMVWLPAKNILWGCTIAPSTGVANPPSPGPSASCLGNCITPASVPVMFGFSIGCTPGPYLKFRLSWALWFDQSGAPNIYLATSGTCSTTATTSTVTVPCGFGTSSQIYTWDGADAFANPSVASQTFGQLIANDTSPAVSCSPLYCQFSYPITTTGNYDNTGHCAGNTPIQLPAFTYILTP